MQPAKRPRSPRRPKNQPEPPALPEGTDTAAKDPADTEDDVLVAGRRKSQRRRAATTQPIKRGDDKNPTT
ncbi:hypothetical protein [Actinomadura madurae]|nr:hypothetical protein [Actinomadura madurae]MCP9978716.1 hypothetical protein [Actinomadura madurae]MCQ0014912.1 hypothetical protein [Actinomadura madurae]